METRVFRTNLNCGSCIASITPFLDKDPEIDAWEADVEGGMTHLRVSGEAVDIGHIRELVREAGFDVYEEIPPGAVETYRVSSVNESPAGLKTYVPIFLIFGFLLLGVWAVSVGTGIESRMIQMNHFMGGFFLVFSFFKLLNVSGFAEVFRTYDVIAKRSSLYAYAYPFIEFALGIAFLTGFRPGLTYSAAAVVTGIGSIGVFKSLIGKNRIRCACLGSFFNLPMSSVSLIENVVMFTMSVFMLARM